MPPPKRQGGETSGTTNLGEIKRRLDDLERRVIDIAGGDGSQRVIHKMIELEQSTRDNCNSLLALCDDRKRAFQVEFQKATDTLTRLAESVQQAEARLARKADTERQEMTTFLRDERGRTQELLDSLATSIADVESRAILSVERLFEFKEGIGNEIEDLQRRLDALATDQTDLKDRIQEKVDALRARFDGLESMTVSSLRALRVAKVSGNSMLEEREERKELQRRARSASTPRQLLPLIQEAQGIAYREKSAERGRSPALWTPRRRDEE